jgi:hypothetical protein
MKLLSISNAKAIWLFPTVDLNPLGRHRAGLLEAVRDRYEFQQVPNADQLLLFATKKQALTFSLGHFNSAQGPVEVALSYYADGLIAETRAGSEVSEEFLADLLTWAHDSYGTTDFTTLKITKVFSSELYVSFENNLNSLNERLPQIAVAYGSKAQWPGESRRFQVTGLTFGVDPASKSQVPPLRIERDINAPFDNSRYYTVAPVPTPDHLALLRQFEDVLIP